MKSVISHSRTYFTPLIKIRTNILWNKPVTIRILVILTCVASLGLVACGSSSDSSQATTKLASEDMAQSTGTASAATATADINTLHQRLLTIDTHVDIPEAFATESVDPGARGTYQVDLVKRKEGNLSAVFYIVYVGQTERTAENFASAVAKARKKFDAIHRMTDSLYPDLVGLAVSAEDVIRIRQEGKLVALIGVENGFAFGADLSTVEEYYNKGMRYAGFAHIGHSNFADSSMARADLGDQAEEHGGLSELGKQLLVELNRLGVMADVSHASKATTLDLARLSKAPVIASHSGVRSVYDHPRNLDDEELLAVKNTGGVVQVVGFDIYLAAAPAEKVAAGTALREKYNVSRATRSSLSAETIEAYGAEMKLIHEKWPRSSVEVLVDHIDYAVKLIGIEHVGISSDFDGGGGLSRWTDASHTPNVTEALIKRGYSETDIKKLWGENLLRVMRKVESMAEK